MTADNAKSQKASGGLALVRSYVTPKPSRLTDGFLAGVVDVLSGHGDDEAGRIDREQGAEGAESG
jgi:hypothetical protein